MKVLHGIDITSVSRIREALKLQGTHFVSRIFTEDEKLYCQPKRMREEHYAARFAAKEAFCKAVSPVFKIKNLKDVEVRKEPSGKPYIHLSAALKKKLRFPPAAQIQLSLAHEREIAMASVVIAIP